MKDGFEGLKVYELAYAGAMRIFRLSKAFPKEEKCSLSDQIRRSSRSVCSNTAEAYRKRRYLKHYVMKLTDADGEASETIVWLNFARIAVTWMTRLSQHRVPPIVKSASF